MSSATIVLLSDRGWVVEGTDLLLYPNGPTVTQLLLAGYSGFNISYNGETYNLLPSELIPFLERPHTFLPYPQTLILDGVKDSMKVGEQLNFTATLYCSNSTTKDVTDEVEWETNRPDVIDINSSGVVEGLSKGVAVLYAKLGRMKTSNTIIVLNSDEELFPLIIYKNEE